MERKFVLNKVIPPASALAFVIKKGQYLRIIDLEGKQVGDLVLFNEHDYTNKLSCSYTRSAAGKLEVPFRWKMLQGLSTGHKVMSTTRHHMMTVTADTPVPGGVHDLTSRACSSATYEMAGFEPRDGCLELLTKVLAPYGIAQGDIPDALQIFMNVCYDHTNGMLITKEPVSRPGDYIEFRAEMDCLGALSACPDNVVNFCNGRPPHKNKPLKIQILGGSLSEAI